MNKKITDGNCEMEPKFDPKSLTPHEKAALMAEKVEFVMYQLVDRGYVERTQEGQWMLTLEGTYWLFANSLHFPWFTVMRTGAVGGYMITSEGLCWDDSLDSLERRAWRAYFRRFGPHAPVPRVWVNEAAGIVRLDNSNGVLGVFRITANGLRWSEALTKKGREGDE